ncbi:MAG: NAD(P)/FAD-dependent oxidoreductase [Chloroflexota bacterium]|nr:MAG: NAD(P)/FAD-dependent oxidoreductase [Chloroflexota bacterium]
MGSGPNGLAAAITLAEAGRSVLVVEGQDTIGGGSRSSELTLPGFVHDVCSAIHPSGLGSPFFRRLPLDKYGLEWIHPSAPLAHPFDDGEAVLLERSVEATASRLGADERAYRNLMELFVEKWEQVVEDILGPLPLIPEHPLLLARFGLIAVQSTLGLVTRAFKGPRARALFAGTAAHVMLPLEKPFSAGFGMGLNMLGHAVGWPIPRRGSQQIVNALAEHLKSLGGEIVTGHWVKSIDELPQARSYLFDTGPRQMVSIAGDRLPPSYHRQIERYRYGLGAFKVDFALHEPIPWKASECGLAGTVHLGGTAEEIAAAERATWHGEIPERPYVLVAQSSRFDPTRAPAGKHTAWAYCHVPNGWTEDISERIEAQIERFAPGFRDCIIARSVLRPVDLERYNPNYVGGDINGGVQDLGQMFTRPVARIVPYSTPAKGIYICSSSTPPGGGVHGMCGYYAAQAALKD